MTYQVDESLLGGLVIRIGDRVVDSSIKNRLQKLSGELSKIQLKVGEGAP
jgi:F-type H+-transporting ATPase subunit delta